MFFMNTYSQYLKLNKSLDKLLDQHNEFINHTRGMLRKELAIFFVYFFSFILLHSLCSLHKFISLFSCLEYIKTHRICTMVNCF